MRRIVSGIVAAIALASVVPGPRARDKDGRLTGGYILGSSMDRGGNRQVFASVAGRRKKKGKRF